jgi:uncharacterized protein (TIGR02001 family)
MNSITKSRAVEGDSMMGKIRVLTVAGVLALAPLAASADISGNIGASSNYVFRGISLTGNGAAISGGLDYSHESGLYVGTWASNISNSVELDLYGGYSGEYSGVGYDIGYLYYAYPGPNVTDADYGEIYGSLSYKWFTAGVAYTVNSNVNKSPGTADLFIPGDIYYYGQASYDLGNDWSIGGTIGYYDFKDDGVAGADASYMHYQVDITKSAGDFGDFTLSGSYADDAPYSGGTGDFMPFVSWSKSF